MRLRLVLGILGLSLAVAGAGTSLGADGPTPAAGGPTRTDPQGIIGGGVGEFGGPPGPASGGARTPPASGQKSGTQREPAPRRFGSCGPG